MPAGKGQGERLVLREWQKELIRDAFDPATPDGLRLIRQAVWSMARKNGKTALAAALLLCALVGPLSIENGEVYSAATTKEQAAIIYKMAAQIVRLDDELSDLCKCLDNTKRIVCYHNGSFYQALAAEATSTHGYSPHFCIYDELAQAPNRDLYDVILTSFSAHDEALFLVISTQSDDATHVMSELVDDVLNKEAGVLDDPTFTGRVFSTPLNDDTDPLDEDNWYASNPALGDFKSLASMRSLATKARRNPSTLAAFRSLDLNQRVDGHAAFMTAEDWAACKSPNIGCDLAGRVCYGGLDLSGRRDLSSLVLLFPNDDDTAEVRSWFWTPKEALADRAKQDRARYPEWQADKWLEVIAGRTIDYSYVARHLAVLHKIYKIQNIRFDRYRIEDLKKELDNIGIGEEDLPLVKHGQGFVDMSPAIEELEDLILNHRFGHDGNPVLTYCMGNVKVVFDPAGNRKFDKRQKNRRIDGAVASAMAAAAWLRPVEKEDDGPSVYEERGVLVF